MVSVLPIPIDVVFSLQSVSISATALPGKSNFDNIFIKKKISIQIKLSLYLHNCPVPSRPT